MTFLASQALKHQTIKCYLSAVRHAQIEAGLHDPFYNTDLSRLEYVLKGIKREQASKGITPKQRLPISPAILLQIKHLWDPYATDHNTAMLWAACCLGFFGFLRCAEFTCPSMHAYDSGMHLNLSDVALDSTTNPTAIRVTIKQSKTDPFRRGINIFLGRTNQPLCPVLSMAAYLAIRSADPGPLFIFQDGTPLSRERLVKAVRSALLQCNIDPAQYNGHSFRIGAATAAAACGIPEATIKMLGRWKSSAYTLYIQTPRSELATISQSIARVTQPQPITHAHTHTPQ